jgi:hypothetical protein
MLNIDVFSTGSEPRAETMEKLMLIKYHDLEAYYLRRRLDFLQILDSFAQKAFEEEEFVMTDDHWKIEMLEREFSDVNDPSSLCETLKKIYPEHLFEIKN